MEPGKLRGNGASVGPWTTTEGRIVLREPSSRSAGRAEGGGQPVALWARFARRFEAVEVDREDATPATDLLGVRHHGSQTRGPARTRAEEDVTRLGRSRRATPWSGVRGTTKQRNDGFSRSGLRAARRTDAGVRDIACAGSLRRPFLGSSGMPRRRARSSKSPLGAVCA